MRKLNLDLDALQVESFHTDENNAGRQGTVLAHGVVALLSNDGGICSRQESVCVCDTTYTQRAPECDPSAETFCFDTRCCGDV